MDTSSDILVNFRIKCLCELQNALLIEAYRKLEEHHPEILVYSTRNGAYFGEVFICKNTPDVKPFFRSKTIHSYEINLWAGYKNPNKPIREYFENLAKEMVAELAQELQEFLNND